jgi:hypothetical protein
MRTPQAMFVQVAQREEGLGECLRQRTFIVFFKGVTPRGWRSIH